MESKREFLVFLSQFDLTYTKCQQIVESMSDELSVKNFCKTRFDDKILSNEQKEKMLEKADKQLIENYERNLENSDIKLVTKLDSNYPEKLKYFDDAPFFLFCKGDISLLVKPSLAVVGTRKPTSYGRMATERLVGDVAKYGVVIISGLAYGVDSIAHRQCLEVGGKTIAVLGSGLNEIYPAEHVGLAKEIVQKGGLIISEYSPNRKATQYTFPARNRIIAGLSDGVLITEASLKSGTVHTRDFALDYGKNVYAVPGNIFDNESMLTNDMIKSGQASAVTCAKDILDDYQIQQTSMKLEIELTEEEKKIVEILSTGKKEVDEIVKESGFNVNLLNIYLTTLEINGIIRRLQGNEIILN